MVTFSDLLTLLLTFFVLLLTMSTMDNKQLRETFGFFSGTYGGLEVEGTGIEAGPATPYDVRYPGLYVVPPGAIMSEAFPENRLAWAEGQAEAREFKKLTTAGIEKKLKAGLKGLEGFGEHGGVEIERGSGGVIVRISEGILFELGKARISQEGRMFLQREGHTDDLPIRGGRYKTNWELSTARAVNVLRYFTDSQGRNRKRFSAVGYGEYKPLVPNTNAGNRAKNRRAEIVILSS
jgi:chemotaxis protein MotB